jgi:hypothetical protein
MPQPDDPPEVCPEVSATLVGGRVLSRLEQRGIQPNGIRKGLCGRAIGYDYEAWQVSVGVMHWKDVDTAIAIVDDVLRELGVGHYFGLSVMGMPCLQLQ